MPCPHGKRRGHCRQCRQERLEAEHDHDDARARIRETCSLCGTHHGDVGAALRCCSEVFEDEPVDGAGGTITDGGQPLPDEFTQFRYNILAVLYGDPRYGLSVKRELEEYYGEEINHGRMYPNIDWLVDAGLVEKSARDKRTNEYALTPTGEIVVEERRSWLVDQLASGEPTDHGEHADPASASPDGGFEFSGVDDV